MIIKDQLPNEYFEAKEKWIKYLKSEDNTAATKLYFDKILPFLLPFLRKRIGDIPKYDGIISLLGFTPETSVITYRVFEPKCLILLHSPETEKYLDVVVKNSGISIGALFHEPFLHDETHIDDIYLALKRALIRFNPGDKIAIELTGGKKTMSVQLAIAAGVLEQNIGFNIDVCYVDYDDYLPEYRKPLPESMRMLLISVCPKRTIF